MEGRGLGLCRQRGLHQSNRRRLCGCCVHEGLGNRGTEEGDDTLDPSVSEIEWKGLLGPYKNKRLSIHLHMGPKMLQAYIMAYFSFGKNYNGIGIVSQIVMVCFRNSKAIMA